MVQHGPMDWVYVQNADESKTAVASTNQNIFANTINQLSRIQTYNVLAKSRFRPDR